MGLLWERISYMDVIPILYVLMQDDGADEIKEAPKPEE